jgi:hypothetical protein
LAISLSIAWIFTIRMDVDKLASAVALSNVTNSNLSWLLETLGPPPPEALEMEPGVSTYSGDNTFTPEPAGVVVNPEGALLLGY